jgi:hypothetical protein
MTALDLMADHDLLDQAKADFTATAELSRKAIATIQPHGHNHGAGCGCA